MISRSLFKAFWLVVSLTVLSSPGFGQGKPAHPQSELNEAKAGEDEWTRLLGNSRVASSAARQPGFSPAVQALQTANEAREYYKKYPSHSRAVAARRLEAFYLIAAVAAGDLQAKERMEAVVQAFRRDPSIPVYQRAAIAGSYESRAAYSKIKSPEDEPLVYEAIARALIQEFPTAPQGYQWLLSVAMEQKPPRDLQLIQEVLDSPAPAATRGFAQKLSNRLLLKGRQVAEVFASLPDNRFNKVWKKGQRGSIYFWATWNPGSLAIAQTIAAEGLNKINLVGICLDADEAVGMATARSNQLSGELFYLKGGTENPLAVALGACETPLVFLVDERGVIVDVRGDEALTVKLQTFIR